MLVHTTKVVLIICIFSFFYGQRLTKTECDHAKFGHRGGFKHKRVTEVPQMAALKKKVWREKA